MRAILKSTVVVAPHLRAKAKDRPANEWPAMPRPVRVLPTFARRVRVYKAAGLLVATAERHARRDACAGCEFAQATGHRGLWRCTHRSCGCGGGDELRMAMPATRCPLKAEPEGLPTEHTDHTEESETKTKG